MVKVPKDVFKIPGGSVSTEAIQSGKISALEKKSELILEIVEDLEHAFDAHVERSEKKAEDDFQFLNDRGLKTNEHLLELIELSKKKFKVLHWVVGALVVGDILTLAAVAYSFWG